MGESEKIVYNGIVRLVTCDWDQAAIVGIRSNVDFRITEKGKSDNKKKAGTYSIHSPLYGTSYGDDNAYEDRYSCECGRLIGKNYAEQKKICPHCNSVVEHVDIDMRTTGWIILDRDYIIQPAYCKKIENFIGKQFNSIIFYKDEQDRDTESNPFDGIGIIEFRERFSEIMDYYLKKNSSNKFETYLFIMSHISQVFVQSIPVYSSHLRPFVIRAEEIRYTKEDILYKRIFTNHELLNNRYNLERRVERSMKRDPKRSVSYLRRENIVYSIQQDILSLWDLLFNTIQKKTGTIRSSINGGRLNQTARNVIVPSKRLRPNEIIIGYTTFLELYKLEIISILVEMYDISHPDAWAKWEYAMVTFDDQIYKIMQYMVTNRNIIVEINRNPTINYGSQLCMKIVEVTPDITDHTMSLPELVLKLFNADFDGDVMNIIAMKITSIADEYYKKLNPLTNIFISRNDGKYNADASIFKDQAICLHAFLNI